MKNAQKPDHVGLNTLIEWISEGRFVIPDFQREFEWEPWDIGSLMRSIFLDYYIGSLLLWKGRKENFAALSCEQIEGYSGHGRPIHIVLDGQQRLTAIHYAFFAPDHPLPRRKNRYLYFIRVDKFMQEDYDEAFAYEWLPNRVAKILSTPEEQFEKHIFPLNALSDRYGLFRWAEDYTKFWESRARKAGEANEKSEGIEAQRRINDARPFRDHMQGICDQYQVAYVELDEDLAVDKVCDIFTQVNSRGVRLDVFDLINALLRPKGLKLKQLWREASQRLQFVESDRLNVYVLQVMSIRLQAYCSPKYLYYLLPGQEKVVRNPDGSKRKEILIKTSAEFEVQWKAAVAHLERAIELLRDPREFGAIASAYLPYVSILPTFAALRAHVKGLPPENRLYGQKKLRHWYWSSVFTNRYSGSVESTAARDFLDLSAWMDDDEAEPALIREFAYRFRQLELRGETKKGTSIYNGVSIYSFSEEPETGQLAKRRTTRISTTTTSFPALGERTTSTSRSSDPY